MEKKRIAYLDAIKCLAILMVIATLLSDLVYKLIDPKITFD